MQWGDISDTMSTELDAAITAASRSDGAASGSLSDTLRLHGHQSVLEAVRGGDGRQRAESMAPCQAHTSLEAAPTLCTIGFGAGTRCGDQTPGESRVCQVGTGRDTPLDERGPLFGLGGCAAGGSRQRCLQPLDSTAATEPSAQPKRTAPAVSRGLHIVAGDESAWSCSVVPPATGARASVGGPFRVPGLREDKAG